MTAEQAAQHRGGELTAYWVYEAARLGELPCVRIGRKVRFLREDLDTYVARHRRSTEPAAGLSEDWRRRPQMALAAGSRRRRSARLAAADRRPPLS